MADNTTHASTELRLAWQLGTEDPAAALSMAQLAVTRQPRSAQAWLVYGLLLARAGRAAEALQPLSHAVHLDPQHLDAHMALADILVELMDYKAAVHELQECFALDPLMRTRNGVRARALAMRLKKEIARRMQS